MSLSSDLISQFVKVTKETKPTNKESIAYGTTVEYEGRTWVRLDGSDLLTPITKTTDINDGERVTVLIKDHTATVTGNKSSPSARTDDVKELGGKISEFEIIVADKVSVDELEAESARIDNLLAENVAIRGTLSANEALINELKATSAEIEGKLTAAEADIEKIETNKLDASVADIKYATIESLEATDADIYNLEVTYGQFESLTTNKFTAVEADISKLETDKLDASQADIKYATIANLNATNANVSNLSTDIADIDTLIFGSASGSVIQTSFANAVIAQLGNAQIKSAMIDNISASKINSGDINTNNVRVVSEDGRLVISDETIQISDAARVRVQIGKDASGDYSINIWDASGKLMFSEGGITDSAIKDAIIRNDMVSDNANISASKLDINSLFEEINGSTKTIKSTKIYLDDAKQTLDVAFTEMETGLEGANDAISSQGTQISAIQGQISSKVWQKDIDSVENEMNTKYSSLEQGIDSISATVSDHTTTLGGKAEKSEVTAVENRVSGLEIGLDGLTLSAATKKELEDELSNHYTKIETDAAIKVQADSITNTVSETYATKVEHEEDVGAAQNTANDALKSVKTAESVIQQLADSVSQLVRNGETSEGSLVKQDENGLWYFDISAIESNMSDTANDLDELSGIVRDANGNIDVLRSLADALAQRTEYVRSYTNENDQPCLELGEGDSDFKVIITNTDIRFMDGTTIPAYISNQKLMIEKAEVKGELKQGGFVWKTHGNGNLGLMWIGE